MSTDEIVATLYARPLPPLEPKAPWNAELKARIAKLDEHRYVVAGESRRLSFTPLLSSLSPSSPPPHLPTPSPRRSSLSRDLASSLSAAISPAAEHAALDLAALGRSLTQAALHLANDDIYACHDIAQASEGDPTADLMHATLHRREGDYWNSKYRLGKHPLCPSPREAKAFVDKCEAGETEEARRRQWDELRALVDWTRANCK